MLPDYYATLGLDQSASYLEIKAAYRSLAKEHHPDKHGGSKQKEQLFKGINEAYSVLSNSETRVSYDKQIAWQLERQMTANYQRRSPVPPPPMYSAPRQPYHYAPRSSAYSSTQYVYSKWTLMYGKIFVVLLIMFVVLMPIFLEYSFSNYYYNRGMEALDKGDYYQAESFFIRAMRDLGGSNTKAAIKGAEINLSTNSSFEALNYVNAGLGFAETTKERARLYYLRGLAQKNIKQSAAARIAFENALRFGYSIDSVYIPLAPILTYEVKDYPEAVRVYDSLINFYPNNYDHFLNRGFSYQKMDQHQQALGDFDTFIENKGINGSILYLKAISQLALNESDSACINFIKSEEMGIRNASTFIKMYCTPEEEIDYPDVNPY